MRRPLLLVAAALAVALWGGDARALDPAKSPSQYVARLFQQTDDGLPQNFVPAMAQTRDGYMWLATQEGVVRFDGARYVLFSSGQVSALGTNDIDALAADDSGALWIGTLGDGLVRYADGAFTRYDVKNGLAHDFVLSLLEARDGTLWVGTRGGGVSALHDGHFTTLRRQDGLAGDTVNAIAEGPDGAIWFGTDTGVSRYQGGRFSTVRDGLSDPMVSALAVDPDGAVWMGTATALDHWKDGVLTTLQVGGGVHALLRDKDHNLWIGAQKGIRRLSQDPRAEGSPTPFGRIAELDGDGVHRFEIACFLEDHERNLWAGTQSIGLLRIQDGKVTTFGSQLVWTTFLDSRGALWLGGEPGLFLVQDGAPTLVPGTANLTVRTLAEAPGGLWIGTSSQGLTLYSGGHLSPGRDVGGLSIRSTFTDSHGTLWVGTNYGLSRIDSAGTLRRFHAPDGVPDIPVRAFAETPDGALFIGTTDGILRMKDGSVTTLAAKDGLSNNAVEALYADGDDLWVGTYGGGLDLLRGGRFGHVTTREGLFNDVVYAIVDDHLGDLWMTCNRGLFHAKKADLAEVAMGTRASVTCTSLGTSDGMKSSECNGGVPGGARMPDGLLWFPTADGAVRIDPAHMRRNLVVPPVLIEEMRADRSLVNLEGRRDIDAGTRDFELLYTALSFTAPERVRFKYRLDGFDKDWIEAGARRVAYYTNLPPGRYSFNVIAANDDGIWNETGASLGFVLLPHFYQTLWFRLACALGLVLVGAGSVRLRLVALRVRAAELEVKVEERTQELAKANAKVEGAFHALAEKDALLHEDLLQARAFQERILPRLPSGGSVRFRALYRPAGLVGGDLYDVAEVAEGHYRVFLADTTGHGVQASLRTMVLKTEYDRVKLSIEGPGRVLTLLNQKLATVYPDLAMRCSACCFDVIADEEGATVVYANAAHPPLLLVSDGVVDEIYASSTFLGVVADATFPAKEARLGLADKLLTYTDGICEQEDGAGNAFGVEAMEELLASQPRSAEEIVHDLDAALTTFASGRPLDDDVVLLCVECAGDRRSMVSASWRARS